MSKKEIRKIFRKKVFERDHYRCVVCNKLGKDRQGGEGHLKYHKNAVVELDAHHIQNRSQIVNGGYVPENGISLCDDCHQLAEIGKMPGFTKSDLYEKIGSSLEKASTASEKLEGSY